VAKDNRHQRSKKKSTIECIDAPYRLDAIGNWKGLVKYFLSLPHSLIWAWRTLTQLQKNHGSVIALLPGFSDRLTFSPIIKKLGCPLIWIEIGPLEPTFKKTWGFPQLLYRLTQSLPDHFVTTSKFTMASMESAGGIRHQDITLIYPGIPLFTDKQIALFQAKGKILRAKAGLSKATMITFTGRLASENEVHLVIEAFAKLKKKLPTTKKPLHLLIIGDGPERAHYQQVAHHLGIADQVLFAGFITETDKFSWLATSDVFVFTRAWDLDGFGMTTIEAMTVGTPVITSDFGPQREIVDHGQTGLRFKPHDSGSLAQQLKTLITTPKLRTQLSKNGLQHVRKTFAQVNQAKLMHDTVQKYG
jgi:glycosyltransferase involved in cell wall biosynthesis